MAVITNHLRETAVRVFVAASGLPLFKESEVLGWGEGADAEGNV